VKNRIAFIEPARFRVHQVLHGTAGQRGQSVLNRLQTHLIHRTCAVGIDQRGGPLTFTDSETEATFSRIVRSTGRAERAVRFVK